MARKKRGSTRRAVSRPQRTKMVSEDKIDFVVKKFIIFLILTLVSAALYLLSTTQIFQNFFALLSIVLGFLAVAFFVIMVVFSILKVGKK